ncbi:hypothetical protein [Zavarzinella formosa]|uniref:hypothetical protein n=1 Tax=Zavarzinella formosa TaxID=360055 RepID=UPI0002E09D85|nr:hypothetical protein [Zavarzinella formosa]
MYRQAACVIILGMGCVALAQVEPKTPPATSGAPKEEILVKKDDDRRDLTLLRRISETSFLHEATKTTYTIPKGWTEIRPFRLARKLEPRTSTVLGVERQDRDMVATLYWIPIPIASKFSDWIRETEVAGEYGEEYETLKVVYGADKVGKPTKITVGNFEVHKVNVKGGPDRGEKYDGTLFLFEVASEEGRWIVKARVSYPKSDRPESGEKWSEEVLSGFARVPDAKTPPVVPPVPLVEEKK